VGTCAGGVGYVAQQCAVHKPFDLHSSVCYESEGRDLEGTSQVFPEYGLILLQDDFSQTGSWMDGPPGSGSTVYDNGTYQIISIRAHRGMWSRIDVSDGPFPAVTVLADAVVIRGPAAVGVACF